MFKEKLIITDYDGTLSNAQGGVNESVFKCLLDLRKKNVITVLATGRSLFSVYQVIDTNFPIDYLIFSSGAGIMDWKSKEILITTELSAKDNREISHYLYKNKLDFMIHYAIPDNHYFDYFSDNEENPDFIRRLSKYQDFSKKQSFHDYSFKDASQILAIESKSPDIYLKIKEDLQDYSVIRSTSPLDNSSIWIEIFNPEVSKSKGAQYLSDLLNINRQQIMCIGNDYNDLDLLEWSLNSYIVDNAPLDLQKQFKIVPNKDCNGFCLAIKEFVTT